MAERFEFDVADHGTSGALVYRASDPIEATLILAHGAGAPHTHPFLVGMAERIAARGVDVVTFNFLYAEKGRGLPDRPEVLDATWRAALASVCARGGLPTERVFCGGKSLGGRIATHLASADDGLPIHGLVLLGYPLHPPKKLTELRIANLPRITVPMLFVQGTRDDFGTAEEIERSILPIAPNATLHVVTGADHSFTLPKRAGSERQEEELASIADAIALFVRGT